MDQIIYGNACIKSAFDIALHDLASQAENIPLYKFLGGEASRTLFTDFTVSIGPVGEMAAEAKRIAGLGFPVIKVKLGGSANDDIDRIVSIREKIGMNIPLRIDANQGWNLQSAKEILQRLASMNIQHCEEPLPRSQFLSLPELRKNSPIPIMADESVCSPADAERLIKIGACQMFNIKVSKSGGLFNARKILKLATDNNIGIQVGGFLESRLGFTAAAHLALSEKKISHIDFDTPMMFTHDPVTGGIIYGVGGKIDLPDKPGLGAIPDPDFLESLEKRVFGY
jgi:L-alanine-DL-glutamate epimerase-like enolase superfamily enzyme